jgi:hypothetical protein
MNWQEAMQNKLAWDADTSSPSIIATIFNTEFQQREERQQAGVINWVYHTQSYTVVNASTWQSYENLTEDQVEQALADLDIANSRWSLWNLYNSGYTSDEEVVAMLREVNQKSWLHQILDVLGI